MTSSAPGSRASRGRRDRDSFSLTEPTRGHGKKVARALNSVGGGPVFRPVLRAAGLVAFVFLTTSLATEAARPARAEAQTSPSPATVDSVLAGLARVQGLHCAYREEKRIALLTTPIVTEGTIDYARPGRMARRVTRPSPQVVLIDGGELRMSDGHQTQRIDLASQPVVRSFVDSFVQLLAGDRAALERAYTVSLETASEGFTLVLRPRSAPLTQFLREIRFTGRTTNGAPELVSMTMLEVSGDTTTTTFTGVDTTRHYSDAEARRVFSLAP